MWADLGLALEKHDQLLSILNEFYPPLFIQQPNRPAGMGYFDFVISEVHGLRVKELLDHKAKGGKVFGTFCLYVPDEIITALGGIPVGLCAGTDFSIPDAEATLPRNLCPLIKSFYGFKVGKVCPYIEATDLVIGETTCDGKKKSYEVLSEIHPTYVMEIPQKKNDDSFKLWKAEIAKFVQKAEGLTGKKLTAQNLKSAIQAHNGKRKALQKLNALRWAKPAPISGKDSLLISQIAFYDDPVRFTQMTNKLCDELQDRIKQGIGVAEKGSPRILISGSPMAIPNWKLHSIIEGSGAVVVGEESCVGERNHRDLLDENFSSVDEALEKIASRYLGINCACFTPNNERIEDIKSLVESLHANGVIHYSLQFCTPYMIEAYKAERAITDVPFMRIETDYSMEDVGQLKSRAEAFIEMIKGMT